MTSKPYLILVMKKIIAETELQLHNYHVDEMMNDAVNNISAGKQEGDDILTMTSSSLPDAKFNSLVESLNSDQKAVFDFIKENCMKPPYYLFISGPGGTGKSYIITVIKEYIHRIYGTNKATMTTAPTGVAAFNIQGITLHRALCLPVQHRSTSKYMQLSAEKLSVLRQFWNEVNTLIIDEISMVPYETLMQIHLRLNVIKGIEDPNVFFGGLNIIAVGDFYQLPPVHGKLIFDSQVSTSLGTHLWKDLFHMIELNHIERQKGDPAFIELLSRIRIGKTKRRGYSAITQYGPNRSIG